MIELIKSELRQRIRGRRWWVLLLLWFIVLALLLLFVENALDNQLSYYSRRFRDTPIGPAMFGSLSLLILGLACLIIPSLTSTSINGERDRGTLAVLQSTLYRPREIVGAKFIAALLVALTFLLVTIPLAWWCISRDGVQLGRVIIVYAIIFLVLGLMVLIGLAASSVVRRPALSAAAAYGFVFLLVLGTPILFFLAVLGAPEVNYERQIGWRWTILAPNPVVVLADAAPRVPRHRGYALVSDPLDSIREAVRDARRRPLVARDEKGVLIDPETGEVVDFRDRRRPEDPPALWPWGAAMDVLIAAGAGYLAIERLRTPTRKLATGERVA